MNQLIGGKWLLLYKAARPYLRLKRLLKLYMIAQLAALYLALQACTSVPVVDLSQQVQVQQEAIQAIRKPDSYYLTQCPVPEFPDNESLEDLLTAFDNLVMKYADCRNRHNGLVEQVNNPQ